jgi:thiamine-monophosphate kinase
MEEKRTEIKSLGEFGLIDKLLDKANLKREDSKLSIWEDASILDQGQKYLLTASDLFLEHIHFDLRYFPLQHLGYKAVALVVSDIAAMNGIPLQVRVNLGISNRFAIEALELLYEGISAACEAYNADLTGGDTSASASGLLLSMTAIGETEKNLLCCRNTAREKDIICVTGDLGGAYLGLQVLEREKSALQESKTAQPQLEKYDYLVGRQLKPDARMDIIHELRQLNIVPTAMIDISDGLASELLHLSRQSKVGIRIYEEQIPIDRQTYQTAVEFKLDPITCALNGGEDFELLFTIDQKDYEKLKNHMDIHFIGHIEKQETGNFMFTKSGNEILLTAPGWPQRT